MNYQAEMCKRCIEILEGPPTTPEEMAEARRLVAEQRARDEEKRDLFTGAGEE